MKPHVHCRGGWWRLGIRDVMTGGVHDILAAQTVAALCELYRADA